MEIKYLSHSCFEFNSNGKRLLTDPFLTDNPKAKISPEDLNPDYIILTHGHSDHVADAEGIAIRTGCLLIGVFEVMQWYQKKGIENVHGLNFGGKLHLDGYSLKYLQAHHSSSMPDGSYGGNPGSFIIDDGEVKIFFAGDTSLHYDLKMFGEVYKPDISILPIGGNYTMDIDDAIIAAQYLGTNKVIGCHYDTMPVIEINHDNAISAFTSAGISLELIEIGGSLTV